jgi:hypothetical protein
VVLTVPEVEVSERTEGVVVPCMQECVKVEVLESACVVAKVEVRIEDVGLRLY